MRFDISTRDLNGVLIWLSNKPAEVERAQVTAINRTVRWATGQVARGTARAHQVPLRTLTRGQIGRAGRTRRKLARAGKTEGSVWLGSEPIPATYLGKLIQQKAASGPRRKSTLFAGARAGKHFFAGAFVATMPSGYKSVFKRTGNPALIDPDREEIQEQTVELERTQQIVERVHAQVPKRLTDVFAQRLDFEVNVKGRR